MGNKVTKEVINGQDVTRFNGNNCTSSRDSRPTGGFLKVGRSAGITAWRKRKAQEALYTRRYLDAR